MSVEQRLKQYGTCQYFKHYALGDIHKHACKHPLTNTGRCGFEIEDWKSCPLLKL